jgi:hypothetical protein
MLSRFAALTKSPHFPLMAGRDGHDYVASTIAQFYDAFEKRIFMLYKKAHQDADAQLIEAYSRIILALNSSEQTCPPP